MKIKDLEFNNNVFLAPMAGVTDISFRGLCKEMGCGLVYTEMVSAKALYYESDNTKQLMRTSEEETPVAIQMFGNDPKIMAHAVDKYFNRRDDFCVVDINMGCPAPKIVKNGEGSALMENIPLAMEIIREVKRASIKPVTVKFRKGFRNDNINAVDFAKALEQAGVDAITVHGRTREQMYEGKADWDIIGSIKKAVNVPVIGNGDVFSAEDAYELVNKTNCDGIMVARGSMGNPWIFRQIQQKLNGESVKYPTAKEKLELCIRHYELALKYDGDYKAVREMRKHAAWYIKGLKYCTDIKNKINLQDDPLKVIEVLKDYKEALND